jgi:hypothetical protein
MLNKNFAIFILTHGRSNNVITYQSLKRCGYTGKIYLLIDNEDETAEQYRSQFGEQNVLMFDKKAVSKTFDLADTSNNLKTIVCARNASFQIARDLGLDYFMQLDDDYKPFLYRYITDDKEELLSNEIKSLDQVIESLITFLNDSNALTVAMAQGGDLIGGKDRYFKKKLLRKAMNTFIFKTDKSMKFVGRINEDVNSYIVNGNRGELIFTVTSLQVCQTSTQQQSGGMTETYLDTGTYMKSMYSVMMSPSCVTVRLMRTRHTRPHHQISWNNAVPKIINERHRKPRADTTPLP